MLHFHYMTSASKPQLTQNTCPKGHGIYKLIDPSSLIFITMHFK